MGGAAANPPRHHACCPFGPTSADLPAVPRRRPLAYRSHSNVAGAPTAGQQVHTRAVTVTRQMSPSGSVPRAGPHHKRSLGRRPPCEVAPLPRAPPGQQGQGRPGRGTLDGTQLVGATARPGAAGHHVGLRWEVVSRVLAATTSRTPGTSKIEVSRRSCCCCCLYCPCTMLIQSYCVATVTFKMLTFTAQVITRLTQESELRLRVHLCSKCIQT